jgi:transcriptional regulator with GAF, ATPase, and Fis domain
MMAHSGEQERKANHGLSQQAEALRILWDISQSLYQYLHIDDLILNIIKRTREVINVEGISIILHDPETDEFVFCWAEVDPPEFATKVKETRFPAKSGIAGRVFRTGKPEVINHVGKDPEHYKSIDEATGFHTKSMIAVPLQRREKRIGVFEVMNKHDGPFDEEDLTFVSTLAPIIAMALDNARVHTELERAYNQLQLIDRGKDDLIRQAQSEVSFLRREVEWLYRFDQVTGNSEAILEVFKLCERVIDSDITVLIQGETGTGKELIARTIHYNGPRRQRPFVTQNCAGIPETLLASELFGHEKGAFTGAYRSKKGLFEVANGGTVFLDEVAEMSPVMQTSLLRVLQEGEIKPLGSDRTKRVDVRLISATNKDLYEEVGAGTFREDLLYRLSVFIIELPPLRNRVGDIPILVNHFIAKYNEKTHKGIRGIHEEALKCLSSYPFPGNVRELENEIERAVTMAGEGELIQLSDLSEKIRQGEVSSAVEFKVQGSLKEMVENVERSILSQTLERHSWNKTKAAQELGLSRYGLSKKMQRYGM